MCPPLSVGHLPLAPLGYTSPKCDKSNFVGGLSDYIVGFVGELAKSLSIREQGVAETGRGKWSACGNTN